MPASDGSPGWRLASSSCLGVPSLVTSSCDQPLLHASHLYIYGSMNNNVLMVDAQHSRPLSQVQMPAGRRCCDSRDCQYCCRPCRQALAQSTRDVHVGNWAFSGGALHVRNQQCYHGRHMADFHAYLTGPTPTSPGNAGDFFELDLPQAADDLLAHTQQSYNYNLPPLHPTANMGFGGGSKYPEQSNAPHMYAPIHVQPGLSGASRDRAVQNHSTQYMNRAMQQQPNQAGAAGGVPDTKGHKADSQVDHSNQPNMVPPSEGYWATDSVQGHMEPYFTFRNAQQGPGGPPDPIATQQQANNTCMRLAHQDASPECNSPSWGGHGYSGLSDCLEAALQQHNMCNTHIGSTQGMLPSTQEPPLGSGSTTGGPGLNSLGSNEGQQHSTVPARSSGAHPASSREGAPSGGMMHEPGAAAVSGGMNQRPDTHVLPIPSLVMPSSNGLMHPMQESKHLPFNHSGQAYNDNAQAPGSDAFAWLPTTSFKQGGDGAPGPGSTGADVMAAQPVHLPPHDRPHQRQGQVLMTGQGPTALQMGGSAGPPSPRPPAQTSAGVQLNGLDAFLPSLNLAQQQPPGQGILPGDAVVCVQQVPLAQPGFCTDQQGRDAGFPPTKHQGVGEDLPAQPVRSSKPDVSGAADAGPRPKFTTLGLMVLEHQVAMQLQGLATDDQDLDPQDVQQLLAPPALAQSAFNFFLETVRQKLDGTHPGMLPKETRTIARALWGNMSDEDRAPYTDLCDQDRSRYTMQLEAHNYRMACVALQLQSRKSQEAVARGLKALIDFRPAIPERIWRVANLAQYLPQDQHQTGLAAGSSASGQQATE